MEYRNVENVIYNDSKIRPTYVELIINLLPDEIEKNIDGNGSKRAVSIKDIKEAILQIYKYFYKMYDENTKKEIMRVTNEYLDLVSGEKRNNAVDDALFFYRNYLNDYLFNAEKRDEILSRLHLAIKSYVGERITYLKSPEDDIAMYHPCR